jgi:hypothetical protein
MHDMILLLLFFKFFKFIKLYVKNFINYLISIANKMLLIKLKYFKMF